VDPPVPRQATTLVDAAISNITSSLVKAAA
jgi:hypothetical protein